MASPSPRLKEKIREALQILYEAKKQYPKVYCLFSGGKDSTVLLDLATRVYHPWEMDVVYIEVTGNTHALNRRFVEALIKNRYPDYKLIILKRDKDFFETMLRWGIPFIKQRWCLGYYKQKLIKKLKPCVTLTGIKANDNPRRKKYYTSPIHRADQVAGILIMPLLYWDKKDVLEYIRYTGLPLNPCYEKYGHSGNCMFCPFMNDEKIRKTLADPEWGKKICETLAKVEVKCNITRKIKTKWLRVCSELGYL